MSGSMAAGRSSDGSIAGYALKAAAALWFLVALAGQWAFVAFIAGFYGRPTLTWAV